MRLTRRWLLVAAAALVVLVASALLLVTHVGEDRVGLTWSGDVLAPGWHLGRARIVPSGGVTSDELEATSREGAATRLAWSATWRLGAAPSADAVRGLRERGPDAIVRAAVEDALRETARQHGADQLASLEFLARALHEGRLALQARGLDGSLEVTPGAVGPSSVRDLLRSRGRTVAVIGVDGMDWQVANPLLVAGRLPHLARLIARGVRAELRSQEPMLSPLIWTTMATGRRPEDHGVLDFLAFDPTTGRRVPITSHFRSVPALWNISSEAGLPTVFVGWWATWPPEPVRGALVSDRLAYTLLERGVDGGTPAQVAYPPATDRELRQLVRGPESVDAALVTSFVRGGAAAGADERVAHLRRMLAGALTYHAAALRLIEAERPQLVGVYYELVDQVCHRFMHVAPPRRPDVAEADFAAFSGAVDAAYELQDDLIGELVARLPPDAVVLLVSDHGFLSGPSRPPGTADVTGKPGRWHRSSGVLVAAGGPVAPGAPLPAAPGVEDVAPTVLHLLGLPVGGDMPGRALLGLDVEVRTVDTYDALVSPPLREPFVASEALDAAAVEELAALGYVGAQAHAEASPPRAFGLGTTASYHLNRGACLFAARRHGEASEEALAALDRVKLAEAWLLLSRCSEAQGDLTGAIEASARALAEPTAEPAALVRHADLLIGARRTAEVERVVTDHATRAGAGWRAAALTCRGLVAREAGRMAEARRLLREALAADATGTVALRTLLVLEEEAGTLREVEALVRSAAAASGDGLVQHEALGVVALRAGRAEEAERELRAALALDPGNTLTRARLASSLQLGRRLDEAVREAEAVRAAEPDEPEAWVLVAAVFGQAERPGDALSCIERARARGAVDAASYLTEAVSKLQGGDEPGAVAALREGLRRHPTHAGLRELEAEMTKAGIGTSG
jgi:predicted AlkP superfamily phosphohydrolase/phosphomutase/predicted Zn-dependent protease